MGLRRWLVKRVIGLVIAGASVVGAFLVFALVLATGPEPKPHPSWTGASGAPVPDRFLYVMYPVDTAVPLCDSPGGTPVGKVLGRS